MTFLTYLNFNFKGLPSIIANHKSLNEVKEWSVYRSVSIFFILTGIMLLEKYLLQRKQSSDAPLLKRRKLDTTEDEQTWIELAR